MTNWRDGRANALLESEEGGADIKVLVDAFMRNDGGFSRRDVNTFVNNALSNDAREISFQRTERAEMAETLASFADANRDGGDEFRAEHYQTQAEMIQVELDTKFSTRREALGEVVRDLTQQGEVPITGETREALTLLDADGQMSEAVGFALTPSSGFEPPEPAAAVAETAPTKGRRLEADFSRDCDGDGFSAQQQRRSAIKARQYQEQRAKDEMLSKEASERTEREDRSPVLVGEVVRKWRMSQGRDIDGNKVEQDQDSKGDGPEMG